MYKIEVVHQGEVTYLRLTSNDDLVDKGFAIRLSICLSEIGYQSDLELVDGVWYIKIDDIVSDLEIDNLIQDQFNPEYVKLS